MIIDAHAHLLTPASLFAIRTILQSSNGQHSKEWYIQRYLPEEEIVKTAARCIAIMDQAGTDVQLLSPRPFSLMHSHHSPKDVRIWIELQNDVIYKTVQLYPDRFRGVAGLPQLTGQPIDVVFNEIDRCVNELGFVGVLLNPDPDEGGGKSPRLGDPYWYPLWEKLVKMDVPAHIHSAGCCGRETYDEHFSTEESLAITSVIHSDVFKLFPDLKLMISHGGGAIPYQIGRWRSHWLMEQAAHDPDIAKFLKDTEAAAWAGQPLPARPAKLTVFDDQLKRFWFDTVVHNKGSLELLLKTVGVDRVVLGTERPGSGSSVDLETGRPMDDFKYTIDNIGFLNDDDRYKIYDTNARKLFSRLNTDASKKGQK
ncbi:amidohydrolase family protein [Noviherbaspirillum sedimenti]|uniref:Amidohydrolase n=1 Tax=Noviherbaspirillum sedimenti TaxID=2320865 RepID=A0A3A3GQ32_9BURK|nr:amidohydrolase family protein [Noviherbaspirillum sedimenti]RJG03110.1 amidohydrolase [Noviherbaspirillum sedimenti]